MTFRNRTGQGVLAFHSDGAPAFFLLAALASAMIARTSAADVAAAPQKDRMEISQALTATADATNSTAGGNSPSIKDPMTPTEDHIATSGGIVFPGKEWKTSPPEAQGIDSKKLAEAMNYLQSVCGPIGVSQTVVVRNGFVIWQGENVRDRHIVWSCTKSFMSACLGLLWDDGKCSPSTLARKNYPELEKDYPTITLENLATFTSGYDCPDDDPLKPLAPMYEPGAAFHYSAQSDLLAAILTRIAGEPLERLFQRRIGDEIGLAAPDFHWNSSRTIDDMTLNGGAGLPASGVEIDAVGMARFGWLFCNGGNWNGKQLISRRYIDHASVPRVPSTTPPHDPKGWYVELPGSYGLNWWVNGITPKGHRMWPSAPAGTFAAQGNKNNICFIVPDWKMVIVRLGGDNVIENLYDPMFALIREGMGAPR